MVPITAAGYLLLVIFWSPSTSSGVMTVFLRNSSSVRTGMPMSDELQPCCTFMSSGEGSCSANKPGRGLKLFWRSRRRVAVRNRLVASPRDARWLIHRAATRISHSRRLLPLRDPVKDKNQFSSLLPPFLSGSRLTGSLGSYLIQIPRL